MASRGWFGQFSALLLAFVVSGNASATPAELGEPGEPVAGVVLGKVIRTRDAELLRYVVLGELTTRYGEGRHLDATLREVEQYKAMMRAFMAKDAKERAARQAALAKQLQEDKLDPAKRNALQKEIATLESLSASLKQPATESAEERAARDQIAAAFIRQWKLNRSLQAQFGGRVIYQQGGPEPLDATRKFLEAAQARGEFLITEPTLAAAFWRYYRTDSIHSFIPPGKPAAQFRKAPWVKPWQE